MRFSEIITKQEQEEIQSALGAIALRLMMLRLLAENVPSFLDHRLSEL